MLSYLRRRNIWNSPDVQPIGGSRRTAKFPAHHDSSMTATENQEELGSLSDIYDTLKQDAKTIVADLHGGVVMWREAAGANLAAAGFLLILTLTTYGKLTAGGFGEGTVIFASEIALSLVLIGYALFGLRRHMQLRRKYAGLFERAKKLD